MSTETQRAEFCAFLRSIGWSDSPAMRENGNYINGSVQGQWAAWQAAQASQAAEIEALKADIATYVRAASEQATEIEALRKDAERWRYSVQIGENQNMNWLDVYDDWDGDGEFTAAIDAAMQTKEAS